MNVFVADEQDDPLDLDFVRSLAALTLEQEGLPDRTDVTIMFVNEDQIADYNQRFMQRQGPTDVLAFPVEQLTPGTYPKPLPHEPPLTLGDVVIAPSVVRRQAPDTFDDELALMVVHGLLHLLGYDHMNDRDAERMEQRERTLLAKVGRKRR